MTERSRVPEGYVSLKVLVHGDDLAQWRVEAARAGVSVSEWVRANLNASCGLGLRPTQKRPALPASLGVLRGHEPSYGSRRLGSLAPPCDHVAFYEHCQRCGKVRLP